jgi:hypothetical protein
LIYSKSKINRKRLKGRDFYDITFLLNKTRPDFGFIKHKMGIRSPESLREELLLKIEAFDFDALAEYCSCPIAVWLAIGVGSKMWKPNSARAYIRNSNAIPRILPGRADRIIRVESNIKTALPVIWPANIRATGQGCCGECRNSQAKRIKFKMPNPTNTHA